MKLLILFLLLGMGCSKRKCIKNVLYSKISDGVYVKIKYYGESKCHNEKVSTE